MAKQSEAAKYVDQSVKLIRSGKFTEAEEVLKKAIEINPYNATAHGNMGGIFLRQGCPKEAIPWFMKALELNPNLEGVPEALQQAKDQAEKEGL
jgi:Flp pilus assembly protein TadD